jgi:transposase-like protein
MGRTPKFDSDFRKHAVELTRVSTRPRSKIAFDLGVSDATLSKWMDNSKSDPKNRRLSLVLNMRSPTVTQSARMNRELL